MTIQQLEGFAAVARHRSFTKAAEELFISQPALTKQLKELEKELSCVLFVRTTRSVQLTESGKLCLKYAKDVLKNMAELKAAVQEDTRRRFTLLRVGYVTTTHVPFVEKGLQPVYRAYPEIEVHIEKGNPPDLISKLKDHTLDCAFLHLPSVQNQKMLHYDTVLRGGIVARVPVGHRFAGRESICCRDMDGEPLITGKDIAPACFAYTVERMNQAGARPVYIEGSSEEAIRILTRSRKVISLTSEFSEAAPGFTNIPVTDMSTGFDLVIARMVNSDNPVVRLFCDTVRAGGQNIAEKEPGPETSEQDD